MARSSTLVPIVILALCGGNLVENLLATKISIISSEACFDKAPNCKEYAFLCGRHFFSTKDCARTCGLCDSDSNGRYRPVPSPTTPPIKDRTTTGPKTVSKRPVIIKTSKLINPTTKKAPRRPRQQATRKPIPKRPRIITPPIKEIKFKGEFIRPKPSKKESITQKPPVQRVEHLPHKEPPKVIVQSEARGSIIWAKRPTQTTAAKKRRRILRPWTRKIITGTTPRPPTPPSPTRKIMNRSSPSSSRTPTTISPIPSRTPLIISAAGPRRYFTVRSNRIWVVPSTTTVSPAIKALSRGSYSRQWNILPPRRTADNDTKNKKPKKRRRIIGAGIRSPFGEGFVPQRRYPSPAAAVGASKRNSWTIRTPYPSTTTTAPNRRTNENPSTIFSPIPKEEWLFSSSPANEPSWSSFTSTSITTTVGPTSLINEGPAEQQSTTDFQPISTSPFSPSSTRRITSASTTASEEDELAYREFFEGVDDNEGEDFVEQQNESTESSFEPPSSTAAEERLLHPYRGGIGDDAEENDVTVLPDLIGETEDFELHALAKLDPFSREDLKQKPERQGEDVLPPPQQQKQFLKPEPLPAPTNERTLVVENDENDVKNRQQQSIGAGFEHIPSSSSFTNWNPPRSSLFPPAHDDQENARPITLQQTAKPLYLRGGPPSVSQPSKTENPPGSNVSPNIRKQRPSPRGGLSPKRSSISRTKPNVIKNSIQQPKVGRGLIDAIETEHDLSANKSGTTIVSSEAWESQQRSIPPSAAHLPLTSGTSKKLKNLDQSNNKDRSQAPKSIIGLNQASRPERNVSKAADDLSTFDTVIAPKFSGGWALLARTTPDPLNQKILDRIRPSDIDAVLRKLIKESEEAAKTKPPAPATKRQDLWYFKASTPSVGTFSTSSTPTTLTTTTATTTSTTIPVSLKTTSSSTVSRRSTETTTTTSTTTSKPTNRKSEASQAARDGGNVQVTNEEDLDSFIEPILNGVLFPNVSEQADSDYTPEPFVAIRSSPTKKRGIDSDQFHNHPIGLESFESEEEEEKERGEEVEEEGDPFDRFVLDGGLFAGYEEEEGINSFEPSSAEDPTQENPFQPVNDDFDQLPQPQNDPSTIDLPLPKPLSLPLLQSENPSASQPFRTEPTKSSTGIQDSRFVKVGHGSSSFSVVAPSKTAGSSGKKGIGPIIIRKKKPTNDGPSLHIRQPNPTIQILTAASKKESTNAVWWWTSVKPSTTTPPSAPTLNTITAGESSDFFPFGQEDEDEDFEGGDDIYGGSWIEDDDDLEFSPSTTESPSSPVAIEEEKEEGEDEFAEAENGAGRHLQPFISSSITLDHHHSPLTTAAGDKLTSETDEESEAFDQLVDDLLKVPASEHEDFWEEFNNFGGLSIGATAGTTAAPITGREEGERTKISDWHQTSEEKPQPASEIETPLIDGIDDSFEDDHIGESSALELGTEDDPIAANPALENGNENDHIGENSALKNGFEDARDRRPALENDTFSSENEQFLKETKKTTTTTAKPRKNESFASTEQLEIATKPHSKLGGRLVVNTSIIKNTKLGGFLAGKTKFNGRPLNLPPPNKQSSRSVSASETIAENKADEKPTEFLGAAPNIEDKEKETEQDEAEPIPLELPYFPPIQSSVPTTIFNFDSSERSSSAEHSDPASKPEKQNDGWLIKEDSLNSTAKSNSVQKQQQKTVPPTRKLRGSKYSFDDFLSSPTAPETNGRHKIGSEKIFSGFKPAPESTKQPGTKFGGRLKKKSSKEIASESKSSFQYDKEIGNRQEKVIKAGISNPESTATPPQSLNTAAHGTKFGGKIFKKITSKKNAVEVKFGSEIEPSNIQKKEKNTEVGSVEQINAGLSSQPNKLQSKEQKKDGGGIFHVTVKPQPSSTNSSEAPAVNDSDKYGSITNNPIAAEPIPPKSPSIIARSSKRKSRYQPGRPGSRFSVSGRQFRTLLKTSTAEDRETSSPSPSSARGESKNRTTKWGGHRFNPRGRGIIKTEPEKTEIPTPPPSIRLRAISLKEKTTSKPPHDFLRPGEIQSLSSGGSNQEDSEDQKTRRIPYRGKGIRPPRPSSSSTAFLPSAPEPYASTVDNAPLNPPIVSKYVRNRLTKFGGRWRSRGSVGKAEHQSSNNKTPISSRKGDQIMLIPTPPPRLHSSSTPDDNERRHRNIGNNDEIPSDLSDQNDGLIRRQQRPIRGRRRPSSSSNNNDGPKTSLSSASVDPDSQEIPVPDFIIVPAPKLSRFSTRSTGGSSNNGIGRLRRSKRRNRTLSAHHPSILRRNGPFYRIRAVTN